LVVAQKVDGEKSVPRKSVPPTAVLYGVLAKALTPIPLVAYSAPSSQPSDPLSPVETK
jgi:hypothetical protein